jgi:hypothetical protein
LSSSSSSPTPPPPKCHHMSVMDFVVSILVVAEV